MSEDTSAQTGKASGRNTVLVIVGVVLGLALLIAFNMN